MTLSAKLRRAPTRIATGAYILNSGIGKLGANEDVAKASHGFAAGAYPVFEKMDHKVFIRLLGAAEVGLGAALLAPVVPAAAAGIGLIAFSGGLLGLYWRTPGMHEEGSPRPTQQGSPIAKDVWMFGIGTSLVLDAVFSTAHDKRVEATHELKEATIATRTKGRLTAKAAGKTAGKTAKAAGKTAKTAGTAAAGVVAPVAALVKRG